MKNDYISREEALKAIKIPDEEYSNPSERVGIIIARVEARRRIRAIPSEKVIPIEPLANFIVENLDPRVNCIVCKSNPNYEHTDCLYDCPHMTKKQVLEALEKWIETQNEMNDTK